MKILNITASKKLLGVEDLEIGTGHVTQTRSGITKKFYHKIPLQYNMGLLSKCIFEEIPNDLTELYFSGYYKEGDLGEGIYKRVGTGTIHNIGICITNGTYYWKRIYDEYVRPEWFGAKGDGKNDDADAFITCLVFGSVELGYNKHYKCELLQTNIIPIERNIDIIGNQATLEITSILDKNKLIFDLKNNIKVKCEFLNFKSNLSKIFNFYNMVDANIKYCNFYPISINPFSEASYFNQQDIQILTTTILEGRNYKTQVATNELHPINKNDLKSLKIEEVPNAVSVNGDVEITGKKIFYKSPVGPEAVDDDQVVTLKQMNDLVKLPQSIKDIIDEWLQELQERQGEYGKSECPYPTSACYIQPFGTKEPADLWPGTEWVKLKFNDGAILLNDMQIDAYIETMGTNGLESINAYRQS